ncbi:MAG: hypothetical protein P8N01_09110, partial [Burkholderiales bacterium]|nr:hypothetical protein [Burkholderiales bacterium]
TPYLRAVSLSDSEIPPKPSQLVKDFFFMTSLSLQLSLKFHKSLRLFFIVKSTRHLNIALRLGYQHIALVVPSVK